MPKELKASHGRAKTVNSNRGAVEQKLDRKEAALKDFDTALRLNPNFADAYQNRGVVKNVLKLFTEALADFNQALELNPGKNNGAIYVGRGISKFYLGDNAGACEDWHTPSDLSAANASQLIAEYCNKDASGEKRKP